MATVQWCSGTSRRVRSSGCILRLRRLLLALLLVVLPVTGPHPALSHDLSLAADYLRDGHVTLTVHVIQGLIPGQALDCPTGHPEHHRAGLAVLLHKRGKRHAVLVLRCHRLEEP